MTKDIIKNLVLTVFAFLGILKTVISLGGIFLKMSSFQKMKVFFVIVVFVIGLVHSINLDIMATYNKKYLKRV